jgi:hypothetical protein
VVAPGQTSAAVQDALLSHCETRKDRFAILDSPETITGGVDKLPKPRDSKYGAYYFPWIQVYDPDKGNIFVPPAVISRVCTRGPTASVACTRRPRTSSCVVRSASSTT